MKKNILVTGGFGLLASTLINTLSKKNFNVISIDKKKIFTDIGIKNQNTTKLF